MKSTRKINEKHRKGGPSTGACQNVGGPVSGGSGGPGGGFVIVVEVMAKPVLRLL